ncbi:MAG: APC family permease [Bacteroidetes bacterium]|nr:MAG: APC family permease [Bacteroidota bacterium]
MSLGNKEGRSLGLVELIAIALGGMVGGGIFSILGISASMIGMVTPVAIIIGGIIASFAAYAYVKLGLYYRDEGATYAFFKRTFPNSHFAAASIGWITIFGYISTLSLYAYTFASYAISDSQYADNIWIRKGFSMLVLLIFTLINVWSVKGMGKVEDFMVYTKIVVLAIISFILMKHGSTDIKTFLNVFKHDFEQSSVLSILIVASITFVAYEGFQLVINAVNEMNNPEKNIPRAIYTAIFLAILIYVIIAFGALFAIPLEDLVKYKEYALAAGAEKVLGNTGSFLVIFGALLATSSAISGTIFGSSRQLAEIARDGYFHPYLKKRKPNGIPDNAIITMASAAAVIILLGGLRLILEFGSITFILVSLLMAYANYTIKDKTNSHNFATIISIFGLFSAGCFILYYEATHAPDQLLFIFFIYILLAIGATYYARKNKQKDLEED